MPLSEQRNSKPATTGRQSLWVSPPSACSISRSLAVREASLQQYNRVGYDSSTLRESLRARRLSGAHACPKIEERRVPKHWRVAGVNCLLAMRKIGTGMLLRKVLLFLPVPAQHSYGRGRTVLLSGLPRSLRRAACRHRWALIQHGPS